MALAGFSACEIQSDFQNKNTSSQISADKMVDILADAHLAETLVKDNILKRDSFRFDTIENYYASIFTIHEVTHEEFNQSLEYYMAHPVEMQEIYERVETKLSDYTSRKTGKSKKSTAPKFKEKSI